MKISRVIAINWFRCLKKCPYHYYLIKKWCHDNKHLSEFVPSHGDWRENSWHKYGMKKLRHYHPMYNATWRLCFSYSLYLISIINIHVETSLAVYFWHYYDRVAFLKQFCLQTTKIHTVRLINKKNFYTSLYTVITSTALAYCYRRSNVVCWSVCLLQSWVLPKRLFGIQTRVGPKKHTLDGVRIGATWQIRLNSPCVAAMRPYVKLLRPLVSPPVWRPPSLCSAAYFLSFFLSFFLFVDGCVDTPDVFSTLPKNLVNFNPLAPEFTALIWQPF